MARQLQSTQIRLTTSQVGICVTTLLLCALALFMCASHSRKWRRRGFCYGSHGHDPVIQLNPETVMMGAGVGGLQDASTFTGEQGVAVWQKNILMGGKCELPDFSGVIIYDSEGQIVPPAKNPRPLLTWK